MRSQPKMLNLQRALMETIPAHPLLMKLEQHGTLPAADRALLIRMLADIRTFDRRRDIIRVGENPEFVHLMIEGWACRYSIVDDGQRQITAFLVPGDFCDAHITMLGSMDSQHRRAGPSTRGFHIKGLNGGSRGTPGSYSSFVVGKPYRRGCSTGMARKHGAEGRL